MAGQNRRARESFQGGFLHAKAVHREVDEAQRQGGRPLLHPVVSLRRINELRVGHDGMLVAAALLLQPGRGGVRGPFLMHEVVVEFLAPGRGRHDRGLVVAPDDVAAENISARGKPNVRVQTGTNRDVVLNRASIPFAVLDAAVQTEIVGDDVK